jgi:hypothetical protein
LKILFSILPEVSVKGGTNKEELIFSADKLEELLTLSFCPANCTCNFIGAAVVF